jgi:CheY-like chemotaxis protein
MLETAFRKKGFAVFSASGGREALDILRRENVHIMFFDLKMPEMNGVELCRAVKQDNPISIIYALTGYATLFEVADCLEAGFSDYFIKPARLEQLFKAADDAVEKITRWKEIARSVKSSTP